MAAPADASADSARREKKKAMREWYMANSMLAEPLSALERSPPAQKVFGPSGREYQSTSLLCMRVADQPRKASIYMVESWWFDPLILVTILTNCTTMAWESPLDPPGTQKAAFIAVLEVVYLGVFTFELVSKVVAYGFVMHEGSYLRDPWCQLDFVVVSLAWLPILFPNMGDYSVIRSVRALRPLRALKRVPGMPQMISALVAALPKCAHRARPTSPATLAVPRRLLHAAARRAVCCCTSPAVCCCASPAICITCCDAVVMPHASPAPRLARFAGSAGLATWWRSACAYLADML